MRLDNYFDIEVNDFVKREFLEISTIKYLSKLPSRLNPISEVFLKRVVLTPEQY